MSERPEDAEESGQMTGFPLGTLLESELRFHPLSTAFPLLSEERLAELADNIAEQGQLDPIVMLDGEILEGRNRAIACLRKGIEPITTEFTGDDPMAFVRSKNLHRRDLTPGQRAAAILKLETYGATGGTRTGRKKAATVAKVSTGLMGQVERTKRESPELFEQIAEGKVTPKQAERILRAEANAERGGAGRQPKKAPKGDSRSRPALVAVTAPTHTPSDLSDLSDTYLGRKVGGAETPPPEGVRLVVVEDFWENLGMLSILSLRDSLEVAQCFETSGTRLNEDERAFVLRGVEGCEELLAAIRSELNLVESES